MIAQHLMQHVIPLIPGEINIDIRRIIAAGVEKPLVIKIVFQWADIGYLKTVGNQRRSP